MWIQEKADQERHAYEQELSRVRKDTAGRKTKDFKDVWRHENASIGRKKQWRLLILKIKTAYFKDKDSADTQTF